MTVVLDTEVTPELKLEGNVREIVSKVQTMRKEAGFEVTDHINVYYKADGEVKEAFEKGKDKIMTVVLAETLNEGENEGYTQEIDVNGEKATVTIAKA